MGGMEMMMKSLGFDPENIKKQVSDAGEDFKKVVKHFDERLNKIENVINLIHQNQLKIMACQQIEPVIAPKNEHSTENSEGNSALPPPGNGDIANE